MQSIFQTTLRRPVRIEGIGLHSGKRSVRCHPPAPACHGIWFRRTDLVGVDTLIAASWDAVTDTTLNTRIGNAAGVTVSTIEHSDGRLAGHGCVQRDD